MSYVTVGARKLNTYKIRPDAIDVEELETPYTELFFVCLLLLFVSLLGEFALTQVPINTPQFKPFVSFDV